MLIYHIYVTLSQSRQNLVYLLSLPLSSLNFHFLCVSALHQNYIFKKTEVLESTITPIKSTHHLITPFLVSMNLLKVHYKPPDRPKSQSRQCGAIILTSLIRPLKPHDLHDVCLAQSRVSFWKPEDQGSFKQSYKNISNN